MHKLVKLALLSGASWGMLAQAASADPISAAIVTVIGFTGFAATAASAVISVALSGAANFGLSLLSKKLTKKPKPAAGGIQGQADIGLETYRKVVFGLCPVDGRLVYFKGQGASNSVLHMVWQICDWECESLQSVIINGDRKTLTPVTAVGNEHARFEVQGYGSSFIIKFFRGAWDQGPDTELIAASSDTLGQSIGPWTADHIGKGVCYAVGKMVYDQTLFQSGFPNPKFEIKGAKLYDIRKDSTAGGLGAHRWNDPTTWEFSENPAIFDFNYERGFIRNGQLLLGKKAPIGRLLVNQYIASANVCDEALVEGGLATKRYIGSVIATSEAEHKSAKEAFGLAMAADFIVANGLTAPIAAAANSVYPVPLTDDDVIGSEDHEFTTASDDPYNAVACKFINPDVMWQSDDLALLKNDTWAANDGGDVLIKDLDLTSVRSSYQAARIQSLIHNQSRMTAFNRDTFHRKFSDLELGDWVTRVFNRDGYGATTYTMKVAGIFKHPDRCVTLTLVQCAAANHTPPVGAPVVTPPGVVIPAYVLTTFVGFSAQASFVEAAGQSRPVINLAWTAPSDPSVAAVQIEYRLLNNATSLRTERVTTPENGAAILASDILAATTYQVRIRPEYTSGGVGNWTAWAQVETTTQFSVLSAQIAHDTQDTIMRAWQVSGVPDMLSAMLENWDRYESDWDVATQSSTETMRVSNTANTASASIEEFKIVYVNDQAAFAASLLEVEATANGSTAGGLMKFEAESSPAGAASRIILSTRVATTGGAGLDTFNQAGMVMETKLVSPGVYKSSVAFLADSFSIVTNPAAGVSMVPFSVISGEVYINSLIMGGTLRSGNFVTGQSGWAVFQNGTAEFQQGIFGGITSSKYPFELSYGTAQDGVFSDEITGSINTSVAVLGGTITIKGNIKRTPTSIEYDIDTTYAGGQARTSKESVPKAADSAWAATRIYVGQVGTPYSASLRFTNNGELWADTVQSSVASTKVLDFLNNVDLDPLQRLPMNSTDYLVFKSRVINGLKRFRMRDTVLVSGVPTPVVGMRVWMWGAAGTGAGGFVKFDIALTPGQMLWVLVGDHVNDGFGGVSHGTPGSAADAYIISARGGGGSFIGTGKLLRANILGAAGGGGGTRNRGTAGGPGGGTLAGGNGIGATDMTRCQGFDGYLAGGGGGYEGGGTFGAFDDYGKGGTNYVSPSAINTTLAAGSENGSGNWTTGIPGSGEAVYTTHKTNDQGRPDVAVPGTWPGGTADHNIGGPGMVVIQYLTII